MADRASDKFIGFHRLVDACRERGCPVCACLAADTRRYLATVLREHVTDPASRSRLRAAWGFCNWHAWILRETSDAAFGTAILTEDLLRLIGQRVQRAADRPVRPERGLVSRLRALASRAPVPDLVRLHRRRAVCPACAEVQRAESRYLDTAVRFARDAGWIDAYEGSDGLCVPHALGVLERGGADLVRATVPKWAALRRDLASFTRKHDPEHRAPFTQAEADAPDRATEALQGRAGLFGNDLRWQTRSARRAE